MSDAYPMRTLGTDEVRMMEREDRMGETKSSRPVAPHVGVAYPVTLHMTPGRDHVGNPEPGKTMWSADVEIEPGISITASAGDAWLVLDALGERVAKLAEPYVPVDDLPERIVVGTNGAYWRDFGDHYSMCPVSTDNDPVDPVAVYELRETPSAEQQVRPEWPGILRERDFVRQAYQQGWHDALTRLSEREQTQAAKADRQRRGDHG